MNKELAKSIGIAARKARKALKLTQEDAAERIGVSVEFYARIERGTSLPSILTFARIVSALGVSADVLLGRQPALLPHPNAAWAPAPPEDSPEIRRTVRRLRRARPGTLRLINLLLKELERSPESGETPGSASGSADSDDVVSPTQALDHDSLKSHGRPLGSERLIAAEPFLASALE